jgi:short subunit dehydrogenase-like uncharacterized protein
MADRAGWMIYGANGFTGHLVAVEAKRQGLHPVLAGRRAGPIEALAENLGLPARVFDLGHPRAAVAALAHSRRRVDFTGGSAMTIAIAWGDLATAYVSTGIPNIETYAGMPFAAAIAGRALNLGVAGARLGPRSEGPAPARGP